MNVINDSASSLHKDLLTATVNAPFSFFYKNDTGSIINRFSQDIDLIDMKLPAWTINTVASKFILAHTLPCLFVVTTLE